MSTSPAFQFYAHDFLAGRVATYDLDEIGAYSLLLAFDWSLNGLPLELERLAKLCRVSRRKFLAIWETIGEQFPEDGDRRRNPRLKLEREKQDAWREKSRAGGKASAEAKAKGGSTIPVIRLQPNGNTPSPSPGSTPSSSSAREEESDAETALAERLGNEGEQAAIRALLDVVPHRLPWVAVMVGALDGLDTPQLTAGQLAAATQDFLGNGAGEHPNLRHFRSYLRKAAHLPESGGGPNANPFAAYA